MCKILIVDDEKMIRMGIKQVIPWNTIGIKEVFTAATAKEALEIMEKEKPDIMLTDISMTEMTGLELISEVRAINQNIRILVLTGYDRFDYARECLRMQVSDFHLKPIDEEVLTESIRKQVEIVVASRVQESRENLTMRTEGSNRQIQLEHMMRKISQNDEDKEDAIANLVNDFSYDTRKKLQVAIIVPKLYDNHEKYEKNFRAMSVRNICMGLIDAEERGITFLDKEYRIVIAYFVDKQHSIVEQIQQLNDILQDEFEIKPQVVVGNVVEGFYQLYSSYNDALYLLKNGKDEFREIVQMNDSQNRDNIFVEVFTEMKRQMCANIGDEEYVLHIFDSFKKAASAYNLSVNYVRRCCFEIVSEVYYTYINDTRNSVNGKINTFLMSLMNANLEETCEMTKDFLHSLLGKKETDSHEVIDKAKRYIEENLEEDLSVSNIASELFVTPNYLSRLFKRIVGEGCNEYIVRKRIEKAKSLLDITNFKTGKIASMVGYRDANYFSLAFKKHTGMSPTEYRDVVRRTEKE